MLFTVILNNIFCYLRKAFLVVLFMMFIFILFVILVGGGWLIGKAVRDGFIS